MMVVPEIYSRDRPEELTTGKDLIVHCDQRFLSTPLRRGPMHHISGAQDWLIKIRAILAIHTSTPVQRDLSGSDLAASSLADLTMSTFSFDRASR